MRWSLVALVPLAACSSAETRRIEEAQREVAATLRDPDSATFRNVRLHATIPNPDPNMQFVCGEVNGNNAFGGRAGFGRFIVMPKVAGPSGAPMPPLLEESSPSPAAFANEWRTACERTY